MQDRRVYIDVDDYSCLSPLAAPFRAPSGSEAEGTPPTLIDDADDVLPQLDRTSTAVANNCLHVAGDPWLLPDWGSSAGHTLGEGLGCPCWGTDLMQTGTQFPGMLMTTLPATEASGTPAAALYNADDAHQLPPPPLPVLADMSPSEAAYLSAFMGEVFGDAMVTHSSHFGPLTVAAGSAAEAAALAPVIVLPPVHLQPSAPTPLLAPGAESRVHAEAPTARGRAVRSMRAAAKRSFVATRLTAAMAGPDSGDGGDDDGAGGEWDAELRPRKRAASRRPTPPDAQQSRSGGPAAGGAAVAAKPATGIKVTSQYKGVTKHRWTGKWEAHLWDPLAARKKTGNGGRTRGKQVYLGAWGTEAEAARAYDIAALVFFGPTTTTNFPASEYASEQLPIGRDAVVAELRRGSLGFARGASRFRGVTQHHGVGKWEARVGRVGAVRYTYLGVFASEEEAAAAYDRAVLSLKGDKAITNFPLSRYIGADGQLAPLLGASPSTVAGVQAALRQKAPAAPAAAVWAIDDGVAGAQDQSLTALLLLD